MRREPASLGAPPAVAVAGAFAIGVGAFVEGGAAVWLVILLAGLVLSLVGVWAFLVARRPHQHVPRHAVVRLSTPEGERRARAGEWR